MLPQWISKNFLFSFFIGFVAGVSPFFFLQIMPALLHPESAVFSIGKGFWWPLIATGTLVGCITYIFFGNDNPQTKAKDVFLTALSIPALMVATVSNYTNQTAAQAQIDSTKMTAQRMIDTTVANAKMLVESAYSEASAIVTQTPDIQTEIAVPIDPGATPKTGADGKPIVWHPAVYREEPVALPDLQMRSAAGQYLIVIGRYKSKESALKDFDRYNKAKMRSERYTPKSLEIFQSSTKLFLLVYCRYTTSEEATKAYKYLRINDPGLSAQIVRVSK